MTRDRAVLVFRVLWFLLPLSLGQAASDAISGGSNDIPRVFTIGLWIFWALGLVASMVPLPSTLTALRIIAPATIPLAVWALFVSDVSGPAIVGLAHAGAVSVGALNQLIGDRFADGASYGDERRLLLRPPVQLSYGLVPLIWLVMVAAVTAGPLLLADRRWLIGMVATAAGLAMVVVGVRALHQLTQRWIVFVPTGMVLYDLMVLSEPVLFRRTAIERLGPAIAGSPAQDLSNRAAGLLIECELTDPAPLGLRTPQARSEATLSEIRRFLFCPTRPGELLDEAERRNIAVAT